MAQLKKLYIYKSNGTRQRYSTTRKSLKQKGYSYNKKSRAWSKQQGQVQSAPLRPSSPKPVHDKENVEWTLHARSNYKKNTGHDNLDVEGQFTIILPEGEKPNIEFMRSQLNGEYQRVFGFTPLTEFEPTQQGLEAKPTNQQRGIAHARITTRNKEY